MSDQRQAVTYQSCHCRGPQPGFPLCPCLMANLIQRDGRWIQPERDMGPVYAKEDTDAWAAALQSAQGRL